MTGTGASPGAQAHGDAWVECRCGNRHWGRHGAAGLLLTDGDRVVLQHRAPWSHLGGTWALPGGAMHAGETPVQGALREAAEEAGIDATRVQPFATSVLQHPDWSYTTVLARSDAAVEVAATDAESLTVAWVDRSDVTDRPLLPAFADVWPALERMLEIDLHVVVDGANVVGSRPDGWWRDRLGAAQRLIGRLDTRAAHGVPADLVGLPGDHWWPTWRVVTEGKARGALPTEAIAVVEAPASGDDTIVELCARLAGAGATVALTTADRELRRRVDAHGVRAIGPGALLELLGA